MCSLCVLFLCGEDWGLRGFEVCRFFIVFVLYVRGEDGIEEMDVVGECEWVGCRVKLLFVLIFNCVFVIFLLFVVVVVVVVILIGDF